MNSLRRRKEEAWQLLGALGWPQDIASPVGVPSGAAEFTPTSISGLYWWAPDRGTFQDAALTTPAVDTNLVGGWVEQSGSGVNGTAATTLRPTLTGAGFGTGLPGLLFDGGDILDVNGLATLLNGSDMPFSLVISVKLTDVTPAANAYAFFGAGNSASGNAQIYQGMFNTPAWRMVRRDDAVTLSAQNAGTADTNTHVITTTFPGTTITSRVDGVVVHSAVAHNVGTITINQVGIGGARFAGSLTFGIKALIGDVCFINRVLTAAEIDNLERFIAGRCGKAYPF